MISIPGKPGSTCDGFSRREFLRVGGMGMAGISLADILRLQAAGAEDDFLHGAFALAVILEGDEDDAEARLAGAAEAGGDHRAVAFHLGHAGDDALGLEQLAVGEFAGRARGRAAGCG